MSRACGAKQEVLDVNDSGPPNRPPHREAGQGRLAGSPGAPLATSRACGVLVVDDEEMVRGVLNLGLRHDGFAVWLAANGEEAVALYRRHRADIDVVLLDVRMPGPDGPQTLAALRRFDPQVRCCFMSGDLGGHTEERLREGGAAAVLLKPFRLDDVARVLGELASDGKASPADPGTQALHGKVAGARIRGAGHAHQL